MIHRFTCIPTLLYIVGSAGCSSVPIHYYTLAPPAVPAMTSVGRNAMNLDVRTVHIPTSLNRSELVIRHGVGELILLDNERWSSPLIDEIRNAVRNELRAQGIQNVDLAASQSNDHWRIAIEIEAFDAQLDQSVLMQAIWSATGEAPGGPILSNCRFRSFEAIGHGYPAIVEGFQQTTKSLVAAIISTLNSNGTARLNECAISSGPT